MKTWRTALIALTLATVAQHITKAYAFTVAGIGIQSCGTWTADRRDPNSVDAINVESWVMGFLSGVGAISSIQDPLNHTDAQGVWAWIDNYCTASPLDDIYQAGEAFVRFHPN